MKNTDTAAVELLNDIYTMGYWITKNEAMTREVTIATFKRAEDQEEPLSLYKSFRKCCRERLGDNIDLRLSALLHDIAGLPCNIIADIVQQPAETIGIMLHNGRKALIQTNQLKATA